MILGINLRHRLCGAEAMMDAAAMFPIMERGCDGRGWD
jgi:hypothetical protein